MTAEEYVKHYASGQGGYESVPVDIALRAIEYAKRETKQQMMVKAFEAEVLENYDGKVIKYDDTILDEKLSDCKVFDKVKIIVIKED